MSPNKSSSRTAISDATIKPVVTPKTAEVAKVAKTDSTSKRKDKFLQISRASLQYGLNLAKSPANASYSQSSSNARCFVAYLAGVMKEKEPELSSQLSAILGLTEDKLV